MPGQTKAVELDDKNAVSALREDARIFGEPDASAGSAVTKELVGKYLSFLVAIGFLERPAGQRDDKVSKTSIKKDQVNAFRQLQGRGAVGS